MPEQRPVISLLGPLGEDEYAARAARGSTREELIVDIAHAFRRFESGSMDNDCTKARAAVDELLRRFEENARR